ncbi:signal peptidase I [Enterococcus moraviensis ATCC BAA-383]|uniref:Signal peptidase I n=1 Tax=Enterococcus moraviensis ATCC BAA-383 TaxID=1158609 RepID=R2RGD1_9ENTE|nr:signal peptidase I [Enterococcus moraviensis]EOI06726.1 signal peptidase I [Enterococcus moraviensis ATCC BAA-383]EOT65063.1 signal peptidase I [Enterococcus moraviensis ATCC BAA-383]OJG66910.1 signal peptidase I [Enterococcus moraviensis]
MSRHKPNALQHKKGRNRKRSHPTHPTSKKSVKQQHFRKQSLKQRKKRQRKRAKKILLELISSLTIAVLVIYLVSLFTFVIPQIEGFGMAPNLKEPNRIFVNRLGEVKRFSLVYFHVPKRSKEVSTRRIIGLPGEKIAYKEDTLLINGQEQVERFLAEELQKAKKEGYQLTEDFSTEEIAGTELGRIPQGKYLVLGDNRSFATDSRYYGLVDEKEIIGVATMKLLPLHEMMKL